MAKVQIIDGIYYRERRGKLVAIPREWAGRHTTKKTIRQRKLRAIVKKRNRGHGNIKGSGVSR